jgi:hypothetical protein
MVLSGDFLGCVGGGDAAGWMLARRICGVGIGLEGVAMDAWTDAEDFLSWNFL